MNDISIIGCGNMGAAIGAALSESYRVHMYNPHRDKTEAFAKEHKVVIEESLSSALSTSSIILIAVKPQVLATLYPELGSVKGKRWISIAAGIPLEILQEKLSSDEVVRFMPNIAAKEKKSVTAVAFANGASEAFKAEAMAIANSFGSAFALPESQFAAFIGISGSGIAYMFQFIHAMALGGVNEGIPYPTAVSIVRDTMESAITLQRKSGKNPIELMSTVCSAGGTTIAGIQALSKGAFDGIVGDGVHASAKKSMILETNAINKGKIKK